MKIAREEKSLACGKCSRVVVTKGNEKPGTVPSAVLILFVLSA